MQFDSDYEVRLATLEAMGGDVTKKYDSVYEIDLAILDIVEHGGGGGGAVIDDNNTSTGTTWSSSKIVSELADAGFDVEIVTELPSTGDAHTIYFMASQDPQTSNVYDEFMYINGAWEQVGSTAIDLSNYYTKSEIDTSVGNALALKANKTDVDASLANYATKNDVSAFITDEALDGYATESFVNSSLAAYAKTADVNSSLANYATIANVDASLANYATKNDVSAFITDEALAGYATESFVNSSLADYAKTSDVNSSLANYATKNDVSAFITEDALNGYATESFVNSSLANYATTNDVSIYAVKSDVDTSLAGKQDTLTAGANITIENNVISAVGGESGASIDDNNVSTNTTWSSSKITSELSGYATTNDISTFITENDASVYATKSDVNSSLANYATKNDVSAFITDEALEGYATEQFVNSSLANYATTNDISTFITENDASVYATIANVDASLAGKQDTLTAGANISIVNNVISATGGGGGGGVDIVEITQDEYDELSTAEKNNGSIYSITDATIITPLTKTEADTYYNPINSVTANSGSFKFPNWNNKGQITGQASQAYQISANINGTSKTLYATGTGDMPTIYAPTSAGTQGYYLVSSGNGAPVWQALEVASDYVISDADASAGTYSSDIEAFHTKTISENVVQGVQIMITDEHTVDNATVYSDSYYLPSSSRIYSGNVELWLMSTEDGVTWENRHYLITGNSITRDITTGTFGPINS